MNFCKRLLSCMLVFAVVAGLLPAPAFAADESVPTESSANASGNGFTVTQSARWSNSKNGLAEVSLTVESLPEPQNPRDILFLIDHAASQRLDAAKSAAKQLAQMFHTAPGTRYALVAYDSSPEMLLNFTDDLDALNEEIDGIKTGTNSNLYDGFEMAEEMIDSRSDKSREACIVLISSGKFNVKTKNLREYADQLKKDVTVYGLQDQSIIRDIDNMKVVCSSILTGKEIAMAAGGTTDAELKITTQLITDNFQLIRANASAGVDVAHADGSLITYTVTDYPMGKTLSLSFSGRLMDLSQTGNIFTADTAEIIRDGVSMVSVDGVSLSRTIEKFSVTYNTNGADKGITPVDSNLYDRGDEVTLLPATMQKSGWNFSGWVHDSLDLSENKFQIQRGTEIDAAWGRAFVKLSSSTINAVSRGSHMMSRQDIEWKNEEKYKYFFYDPYGYTDRYWDKLVSVTFHDSDSPTDLNAKPPADAKEQWDFTDTKVPGNTPGAVMAWVVPNEADPARYDLHISGHGGVTAPKNSYEWFRYCSATQLINAELFDTSEVTDMSWLFGRSNFESLDLSSWHTRTSNAWKMNSIFNGCESLKSVDVTGLVTSTATNLESVFSGCSELTEINGLESWDTSNVDYMNYLFDGCNKITSLEIADWNISEATNLLAMFRNCESLTTLDLSRWVVPRYSANMKSMFESCRSLETLQCGELINHANNVTNMFSGCSSLTTLDLSVQNPGSRPPFSSTESMFSGCSGLTTLTLPSWTDTTKITNTKAMFSGCSQLTSLTNLNWQMTGVTNMDSMFENCSVLPSSSLSSLAPGNKITVADGCTCYHWHQGATNLQNIKIYSVNDSSKPLDPSSPSGRSALLNSDIQQRFIASYPGDQTLGAYGRPVYANYKKGVWDCGEVAAGQDIEYSLELQYLNDTESGGGASGELTVVNQIPEDLTLKEGTLKISEKALRIANGDGGGTEGTILKAPTVDKNNVLTFTVTGLSAGAKYVVEYTCTVPANAPTVYTEYWNNAYVEDNGLVDNSDPVLHYINAKPATMYKVSYEYSNPPAGENPPPAQEYKPNTDITLPAPEVPGWEFLGWTKDGTEAPIIKSHTVTANIKFIGRWEEITPKMIKVKYTYDEANAPDDIETIWDLMLDGTPSEYPENSCAQAPEPITPEGYTFEWEYPAKLNVLDENMGIFNVGTQEEWPQGIEIKGKWKKAPYSVSYEYAGDIPGSVSGLPETEPHVWGEPVELAPEPLSTKTHIFMGWSLPEGVELGADGAFTMPKEDVHVFGRWVTRPEDVIREVKIDPSGGTWMGSADDSILSVTEYQQLVEAGNFPDAEHSNEIFKEWDEAPDPEGNFEYIVTAQWEGQQERCTVRFDACGGSPTPPAQTVLKGERAAEPAEQPAREGYGFIGWYRDPDCEEAWNFQTDPVTESMTLYAGWLQDGFARVSIMQGRNLYQQFTIDPDETFSFGEIPDGIYNVVAVYQNITTTILADVNGQEEQQIYQSQNQSILNVGMETPYLVVGGLELEADSVSAAEDDDPVQVVMDANLLDEEEHPEIVLALQEEAQSVRTGDKTAKVDLIFDLCLTASAADGSNPRVIDTAENVLELVFPYDMDGKDDIQVHLFCDADEPETFTFERVDDRLSADEREDGKYWLDSAHGLIHVYTERVSACAVSYAAEGDYTITATAGDGGTINPSGTIRVSEGDDKTFVIVPSSGFELRDTVIDGSSIGAVPVYTFTNVRADHTIEAYFSRIRTSSHPTYQREPKPEPEQEPPAFAPELENHREYLYGFGDGTFGPAASMTRGQAAQMFYNLLQRKDIPFVGHFSDVPASLWCYEAIHALDALDIMKGVAYDRFAPDQEITRAEFVVTAMRVAQKSPGGDRIFSDVSVNDWFYPQIAGAAAAGWIDGYSDGTFRPHAPISRAEVTVVINRMLGREADREFVSSNWQNLIRFPDVPESHWAYYEIMEAVNAHDCRVHDDAEYWERLGVTNLV